MGFIIAAAALLLVLLFLLFIPWKLQGWADLRPQGDGHALVVEWKIHGLPIKGHRSIRYIQDSQTTRALYVFDEKGNRHPLRLPRIPHKRWLGRTFLRRVYFSMDWRLLRLRMQVGLSDAAWTAWCAGFLRAALEGTLAAIYPPKGIEALCLDIWPDFSHEKFELDGECIVHLQIWHIIVAALQQTIINKKAV